MTYDGMLSDYDELSDLSNLVFSISCYMFLAILILVYISVFYFAIYYLLKSFLSYSWMHLKLFTSNGIFSIYDVYSDISKFLNNKFNNLKY